MWIFLYIHKIKCQFNFNIIPDECAIKRHRKKEREGDFLFEKGYYFMNAILHDSK